MIKRGRKPLFDDKELKNGGKIKLTVKQSEFGYQYAHALRKRTGKYIHYDRSTRELYMVEL